MNEINFIYVEHGYYGCECECCGTDFNLVSGEIESPDEAKTIRNIFKFKHFEDEIDKEKIILETQIIARNFKWEYEEIVIGNLKCCNE